MSKIIYLFVIGLLIASGAFFYTLQQPTENEKKISVPVVKKMIDAKPLLESNKKIKDNKNDKIIELSTIRVSPEGSLLVAGKVFPNSEVELILGGETISKTKSNKTGDFLIVTQDNLPVGEHILAFKIKTEDNKFKLSDQAIIIKLNENKNEVPIVAIIHSDSKRGTKLVQAPGLNKKKSMKLDKKFELPKSLDPEIKIISLTNDINVSQIVISGYALGGIQVDARIYGKDVYSGKIIDNEWVVTLPNQLISGEQNIIVSLIGKSGKIIAKDQISLFGKLFKNAIGKTVIVVQKGDALWKIAYQRLGGGDKYLRILELNKDKIKDPNLIFPKQLFIIPK